MLKNFVVVALLCLLVGCASTTAPKADPWEGLNRGTFAFNEVVDKAVFKPVAQGYQAVTPQFARAGVSNLFSNIGDVGNGLNNLLQGKPGAAFSDIARLVVNSTLGVLGLFDVATPMGLEKHNEDFGQTLGTWGVGAGPYLVVPLMGPSTLRDTLGRVADGRATSYSRHIEHIPTRNATLGLEVINIRAELLASSKTLEEATLDKYQFLRDAFLQRRMNQVQDGKVSQAQRDKLEEELESPAAPAASAPPSPKAPAAK